MRSPPPRKYKDGCSLGPHGFGEIDHTHVCDSHDIDWWYGRTFWRKLVADADWFTGIWRVHKRNWKWWWAVLPYSILGWLWLTGPGTLWWAGWVGPWQAYRDQLKS